MYLRDREVRKDNTIEVFFALVRGGLWEQEVSLSSYGEVDLLEVFRLAEEQSVVGLVTAGLERVTDVKLPKEQVLQFVGSALQIEQQNKAMNEFVASLIADLRRHGIYTLLVKGQSIAPNYERPLWRSCGDVDLFLSDDNYTKTKDYLTPQASSIEVEGRYGQHLGMTIDPWVVELHGSLRCGFLGRTDRVLDKVRENTFYNGNVSSILIEKVQIFKLGQENEVFYVFTHFLGHFYKGGIGLRQICDWCRLLWTFKDSLDLKVLEDLLKKAGLMTEWKAFGAFANEYLRLDEVTIPFYLGGSRWRRKAARIKKFIIKVGNFGHNRDMSYFSTKLYLVRKTMSLGRMVGDLLNHFCIFPFDTLRFTPRIVINGLKSAANGE